jgi:hypothetical protein
VGKWFLMLTFLNAGLMMVCFGLLAKQNHCSLHLVQTFDGTGRFALYFAGVTFVVCFLQFLAGLGLRFKAFWGRTWLGRGRKRTPFTEEQILHASQIGRLK